MDSTHLKEGWMIDMILMGHNFEILKTLTNLVRYMKNRYWRVMGCVSSLDVEQEIVDIAASRVVSGDASSANDRDIKPDTVVIEAMNQWFMDREWGAGDSPFSAVVIEGRSTRYCSVDGKLDFGDKRPVLFVDPCDASLDALYSGAANGMPYAIVLTVAPRRFGSRFQDIQAAVVLDLRRDSWDFASAFRREDGLVEGSVGSLLADDRILPIRSRKVFLKVDAGKHVVVGEMYYPKGREDVSRFTSGQKGYFRNPGCAALEMASVAMGLAEVYFCGSQKHHELGAAWLFQEAMRTPEDVANGRYLVTDFSGGSMASAEFIFQYEKSSGDAPIVAAQSEVVMASNCSLLEDAILRLARASI